MQTEKKQYQTPEITVILLDTADIVTASGEEWFPGEEENEGIII